MKIRKLRSKVNKGYKNNFPLVHKINHYNSHNKE